MGLFQTLDTPLWWSNYFCSLNLAQNVDCRLPKSFTHYNYIRNTMILNKFTAFTQNINKKILQQECLNGMLLRLQITQLHLQQCSLTHSFKYIHQHISTHTSFTNIQISTMRVKRPIPHLISLFCKSMKIYFHISEHKQIDLHGKSLFYFVLGFWIHLKGSAYALTFKSIRCHLNIS